MIRIGILLLFCNCYGTLQAQKFIERVYLKDSITVYEGHIVSQSPTKYVRIYRLLEKDTLQIDMGVIWKITKQFATRHNRYRQDPVYTDRHYKAFYFELFGRAAGYSVNFDVRTARGSRNGWGINAGFGIMSANANRGAVGVFLPFGVNYLFGKKKHFVEVGAGVTYMRLIGDNVPRTEWWGIFDIATKKVENSLFGNFTMGYRFMPLTKGITCRATFSPLILDGDFQPWGGLSIGYQFW
jgi:hypothetical protein